MYTRELQNNMSILNVFKQTGQASKEIKTMQFSDVIGKKYQSSVSIQKDNTSYNNAQSKDAKQSAIKSTTSKQHLKNNESTDACNKTTSDVKDKKTETVQTKSNVKEVETKPTENTDAVSDDEQSIKEALEKELKVSADELDQLMALMGVDLTELQELVNSKSIDVNQLQEICTTLSQIEISSSLDEKSNSDKTLVDKLSNQLKTLIEPLQNQLTENGESKAKDFSEFVDKVEALLKQPDQSLNEKVIVDEAQPNQVVKEETTALFDKSDGDAPKAEVKTVMVKEGEQPTNQTEAMTKIESGETINKIEPAKMVDTSSNKSSEERTSDDNSKKSETMVSVSKEGDLVVTKSNSETNSILDQITLKQPSSITNGTQNSVSSALRSNIFDQIMDAVKTNIKLDDNGSHMLMKLNPEQLGSVELKISIHKGVVLAEINVENAMVKATVESNLDDLKHSLSQKGYQLSQINVSIDSGKKEQEQQFTFNKGNKSKRGISLDEMDDLKELILDSSNYQDDLYKASTINYFA